MLSLISQQLSKIQSDQQIVSHIINNNRESSRSRNMMNMQIYCPKTQPFTQALFTCLPVYRYETLNHTLSAPDYNNATRPNIEPMEKNIQAEHIDWSNFIEPNSSLAPILTDETDVIFESQLIESIAMALTSLIDQHAASTIAKMQYRAKVASYNSSYPNAQCWTIYFQDEKAGQLWTWTDSNELYLLDIIILDSTQGQGIGTACILALINFCKSTHRTFRLDVELGNARAQKLYTRLGLKITNQSETHIHMIKPAVNQSNN